jgi:hypothetical protein
MGWALIDALGNGFGLSFRIDISAFCFLWEGLDRDAVGMAESRCVHLGQELAAFAGIACYKD